MCDRRMPNPITDVPGAIQGILQMVIWHCMMAKFAEECQMPEDRRYHAYHALRLWSYLEK